MKKILIHNNTKEDTLNVKERLVRLLEDRDAELVSENPDLIVVIGGDGTILSAIRRYKHLRVPFVGVNTGNLGFLSTIDPDNLENIFHSFNPEMFRLVKYPSISVRMTTTGGEVYSGMAFNDVIIKHTEPRLMEAKIYFDGKPFNYFTGDGFIISTPLGATGYAIWSNGAAISSDLMVYQLTPLAPNDNSINRPLLNSLIIPHETKMDIEIVNAYKRRLAVACDGSVISDGFISKINIEMDPKEHVQIVRSIDFDYYQLFRKKIIDKDIRRKIDD